MIVYLLMLASIVVVLCMQRVVLQGNQLEGHKTSKATNRCLWIIFGILAFVAMFRYGVGTDFYAYYKTSGTISKFERDNYSDPGFTIFAMICNLLFGERNGAITMGASFVTIALFILTIGRQKQNIELSIILFIFVGCFTGLFNGIRQYLATAVLFAGHRFVIKRQPIKWLLVVLIAASMHITAILMFFIYFICNLKCDWKLVLGYFVIAVVLLYAYEPLFNLVGGLKQTEIDVTEQYMAGHVSFLRVLVQCVPLVMFAFVDKAKINQDDTCRFLFNICLLNGALAIAAMNSPYFSRFWIYTSCFQILMYPMLFSKMNKDNRLLFTMLLIVFYGVFWAYEIMNSLALRNFNWIFKYL